MKRIVILSAIVLLLAGCQSPQKTDRALANQRWQGARATVICGVGQEYFKVGELDKAQASAEQALTLQQDLLPAQILLAKVYLEKGRFGEAAAELRKAQLLAPRRAEIPYLLGVALEKRGQWDDALESYREAMGLDDSNNAYVMAVAEVLVAKGQPKDALALLSVRLTRGDSDAAMLSLAAEVALQADEPAKAAEYFQGALDLRQTDMRLREGLAKAHYFAGHYSQALEQLQKLAAHADYRDKAGWVYSMTGDCLLSLGQIPEAKSAYETASRLDAGEAPVWVGLSKTSLAVKDYQRAAISARRALSIDPQLAEASLLLGYALLCQGQPEEARKCLEPAVRQHPDDAVMRCALGRCYDAQGLKNRASECYLQALKCDPNNPLAKSLVALADEPVGPVKE